MTICSELLHKSLEEFRALSEEEQMLWRLFFEEKNRRESELHAEQEERMRGGGHAREGGVGRDGL